MNIEKNKFNIRKNFLKGKIFLFKCFKQLAIKPSILQFGKESFRIIASLNISLGQIEYRCNCLNPKLKLSDSTINLSCKSIFPIDQNFKRNMVLRQKAYTLAVKYSSTMVILDGIISFDTSKKLDNVIGELLDDEYIDYEDKDEEENITPFCFESIPTFSNEEHEGIPSSSRSETFEIISHSKEYEKVLILNVIKAQLLIRKFLAKKKVEKLIQLSSIKVFELEFTQDGENFYVLIFKKLSSKRLTLYCWNLSSMERYTPLVINLKNKKQYKSLTNYKKVWQRVYLSIEDQKLFYKDYWINTKDPSLPADDFESKKAAKFMFNYCNNKKFRQKFKHQEKFHLVGKKTYIYKNSAFILLAHIKETTNCLKISLFSKRTHDIIQSMICYNQNEDKSFLDFAKLKFMNTIVRPQKFLHFSRMTFHASEEFELRDTIPERTFLMLRKSIRIFKETKKLLEFDYFIDHQNQFIFEVSWLNSINVILFKIFIPTEDKMYRNDHLVLPETSFSRGGNGGISLEISDETVNQLDRTEVIPTLSKNRLTFQILRIDLNELYIDAKDVNKDSLSKFCDLILREKLVYDDYFYLKYFEIDEILQAMFPPKVSQIWFLKHEHEDSIESVHTAITERDANIDVLKFPLHETLNSQNDELDSERNNNSIILEKNNDIEYTNINSNIDSFNFIFNIDFQRDLEGGQEAIDLVLVNKIKNDQINNNCNYIESSDSLVSKNLSIYRNTPLINVIPETYTPGNISIADSNPKSRLSLTKPTQEIMRRSRQIEQLSNSKNELYKIKLFQAKRSKSSSIHEVLQFQREYLPKDDDTNSNSSISNKVSLHKIKQNENDDENQSIIQSKYSQEDSSSQLNFNSNNIILSSSNNNHNIHNVSMEIELKNPMTKLNQIVKSEVSKANSKDNENQDDDNKSNKTDVNIPKLSPNKINLFRARKWRAMTRNFVIPTNRVSKQRSMVDLNAEMIGSNPKHPKVFKGSKLKIKRDEIRKKSQGNVSTLSKESRKSFITHSYKTNKMSQGKISRPNVFRRHSKMGIIGTFGISPTENTNIIVKKKKKARKSVMKRGMGQRSQFFDFGQSSANKNKQNALL